MRTDIRTRSPTDPQLPITDPLDPMYACATDPSLAGYAGGLVRKEWLLRQESSLES